MRWKALQKISTKHFQLLQSVRTQINLDIKKELHEKLEEFATHNDSLEEIFENKEQIEVSRFYERLPKPHAMA